MPATLRAPKPNTAARSQHEATIKGRRAELDAAVERYNEMLEAMNREITDRVEALNTAIGEANDWVGEVHAAQEQRFGSRSERWQSSEAGEAYAAWMEWYADELPEVEIDLPEPIDAADCEAETIVEGMLERPE